MKSLRPRQHKLRVSRETFTASTRNRTFKMGWEKRGSNERKYYYRKSRDSQGRVVSTYIGAGSFAHLVAQLDAASRSASKYHTAVLDRFAADIDSADDAIRSYTDEIHARLTEALKAAGYHYHRGDWRKLRVKSECAGADEDFE